VTTDMPRSEHPRPQLTRPEWLNLNGEWTFEIDHGNSGRERGILDRELSDVITVPFCPESELSGIGYTDFIDAVWYRRDVTVPSEWAGKRVLLHFQAVDHDATVWVNGAEVIRHRGGWSGFTCDLNGIVGAGDTATITVRARDVKDMPGSKAGGKQSNHQHNSAGCHYTRTTGIWQTVWLEAVGQAAYLQRPRLTPDCANGRLNVVQPIRGSSAGLTVRVEMRDEAGVVASAEVPADRDFSPSLSLDIPADRLRAWQPGNPHLYDLTIQLVDSAGAVVDSAESYAGMRSVTIDGRAVRINGASVFQRLVLDQGYYPDGILTAPTDAALIEDIQLSIDAGFNGARLHQKVFEERFLYHADRMGYLVWGEFGDWGIDRGDPRAGYITEWLEILERDYSHPSIVGWCPLNETAQSRPEGIEGLDDLTRGLFLATKAMDQSRPVLDTSGYSHRVPESDIYDSHDYMQEPEKFAENHAGTAEGKLHRNGPEDRPWSVPYAGQPYFVSEFGGIRWNPSEASGNASWGYGREPADIEEFYTRFDSLCRTLLDDESMFAYCYTQLTDVFQEQNGVYFFDRSAKFDMARIRASQQREAAIERE
jgi:beta-galactosidase/beta-glucuronidase